MGHLILHYQKAPSIIGPLKLISQCFECFTGFKNKKYLQNHVHQASLKNDNCLTFYSIFIFQHILFNPLKRRACQICEIRFPSRSEFVYHMLQFHVAKELPYGCSICGFRSSSYCKTISHMKVNFLILI